MADDVLPSEYKGFIDRVLKPWGIRYDLDLLWRMAASTSSGTSEQAIATLNAGLDICVGDVMRRQIEEKLSDADADSLRAGIRDLRRSGADQIAAIGRIIASGPVSGAMTTQDVFTHTRFGYRRNNPNNPAYYGGPDSRWP